MADDGYDYGHRPKRTLVLCFDGTGNQFTGTNGDSNIIKIFSMLDRENPNLYAYYQRQSRARVMALQSKS